MVTQVLVPGTTGQDIGAAAAVAITATGTAAEEVGGTDGGMEGGEPNGSQHSHPSHFSFAGHC